MDGISATKAAATAEDGSTKSDQPVTISAPPAPAVTIDPQNPLPEPSFFYRRVLAYVTVIAALVLSYFTADWLHDLGAADELLRLAKWIIGLAAMIATYYYIAPSAAELTSMIQSAKIIRSSLDMATSADKNATDASISAGNNADRADSRAAQRDSAPRTPGDSGFAGDEPDAAPTGEPGYDYIDYNRSDDIDYAPTGRS